MRDYTQRPRDPLGVSLVAAWRHFWRTLGSTSTMYRGPVKGQEQWGYATAPWYIVLVHLCVCSPLFAFSQAYACHLAHEGWAPWWLWARIEEPTLRLCFWIEKRATWFSYLPANSGHPNEIGFHYRSDLLPRNAEGRIDEATRPRVYSFTSGSGTFTTGTTAATWTA